jgi:hypothetical protein
MIVHKLPASHIVSLILAAQKAAADAGEVIVSIALSDPEFKELLSCDTVKNTSSKWYGSNEGGNVLTDIKTQRIGDLDVPVSAMFNGILLVRG